MRRVNSELVPHSDRSSSTADASRLNLSPLQRWSPGYARGRRR